MSLKGKEKTMADLMHLEDGADRVGAKTVEADFSCSTGKGDDKKEIDFKAHIPATLEDAVKLEGSRTVFTRYLQSLAVGIQGIKRAELVEKEAKEGSGKRARYLEAVGI